MTQQVDRETQEMTDMVLALPETKRNAFILFLQLVTDVKDPEAVEILHCQDEERQTTYLANLQEMLESERQERVVPA